MEKKMIRNKNVTAGMLLAAVACLMSGGAASAQATPQHPLTTRVESLEKKVADLEAKLAGQVTAKTLQCPCGDTCPCVTKQTATPAPVVYGYGQPAFASDGNCAGGSCGLSSGGYSGYGQPSFGYGGFGSSSGFGSAGGGSCAGGSCGVSSGGRVGIFGRRR